MSGRKDLTRWNRAALTRFRYVDGNSVEYLETLRQQLVKQFKDPKTGLCEWLNPAENIPANEKEPENQNMETLIQRQERLGKRRERMLDTYHQDRRDWAWEITRTFARACHILTEHADAYANEGYLGTATQWDNVRRLVEMLDYHPAPPASASTKLALEARESKSGLVKKGWQVKYKPPEGEKVVFETLEDIQVHHELNGMRLEGYNKSPDSVGTVIDDKATWNWVTEDNSGIDKLELSAGNVALLLNTGNDQAIAVTVDNIDNETNKITLSGISGIDNSWIKGTTRLLLEPTDIRKFRLNGSGVVRFKAAHGLDDGDVSAWQDEQSIWHYNQVLENDGLLVRLIPSSPLPGNGAVIFKMYRIGKGSDSKIKFPLNSLHGNKIWMKAVTWDGIAGSYRDLTVDDYVSMPEPPSSENTHNEITNGAINEIYLLYGAGSEASIGAVEAKEPTTYIINGSPGDLASGQWVVAWNNPGEYLTLKVHSITEYEDHSAIVFGSSSIGTASASEQIVEKLKADLRKLQIALDETGMSELTLGEFISGSVAEQDVLCIQGVGETYPDRQGVITDVKSLAQLSGIGPADVGLNELKTRAAMVLEFACDAQTLAPLSGKSLTELLEESTDYLAGLINSGGAQNSELADVGALKRLYGPFEQTLNPKGHDRNETPLGSVDSLTLSADISAEALALLKTGRPLVLEYEDCSGDPVSIEVSKIEDHKLSLSRKLKEGEVFTEGDLIICGNVVLADHGEGKPEKILGSGNAMLSNQSFTLEVEGVAFPADATKSSGVAAAMYVSVDGQIWEQVSTLNDSVPGDHHYAIRMTEEGYVKIIFGDGGHGRRLPTGSNNVRVRYHVGSGLEGNVPAGGLEKPVNPHPLIEAVRQPLPAAGGGNMEDVASLRENAPSTLLALERAVSLSDFSRLAASQSSIWQAKAYSEILHGGKMESVRVVIVAADGGVISDDMNKNITAFLQKHALPGVQVTVENFNPAPFDLNVTLKVNFDEFVPEEVVKAVESAMSDYFTLKSRKLGANLYLSEVYKVVEGIKGVENSVCKLDDDSAIQVIKVGDQSSVIYLNVDELDVKYEEYLT